MVGENFEIFMSEMSENIANCQKSDSPPPGRNLKIQIPSQKRFSPGTWKSDFPRRENPLENIDFSPKFWVEMTLWKSVEEIPLDYISI